MVIMVTTIVAVVIAEQGFGLASRPILVVGMLFHVESAQTFGLVDEGSLLFLAQLLPFGAQPLADLRVVHFGIVLGHFAALPTRPHHERVHGPLDVVRGSGGRGHGRRHGRGLHHTRQRHVVVADDHVIHHGMVV